VLDGPFAGQDVYVGTSGEASILDRQSNAQAAPPDDGCDFPHLVGELGGKQAGPGGCGLGRIAPLSGLPPVVRDLANAITEEERAVDFIDANRLKPDGRQHWELALYGELGIEHAQAELDAAEKKGELSETTATKVRRRLEAAHAIDYKLEKQMQTTDKPSPAVQANEIRQLKNALSLKREAFATLVGEYSLTAKKCTAEKEFDVYAIPAGYGGSNADVFPHGIPRNANHISVSFVDTATGKAPGAEVFPGQTWSSDIEGFRPDGTLDVRVDVAGKGFGKPDANRKHWRVVVSYDC
jgi:hypothetical protein